MTEKPDSGIETGAFFGLRSRVVRRSVIHDDNLMKMADRFEDSIEHFIDGCGLVKRWDDDG